MKKNGFSNFVVKNKYWFLGIFFVLLVASAVLMNFVHVNYDLTEYLPENSGTKTSIELMTKEFGSNGTASIMLENVSEDKAENIANKIDELPLVSTATKTDFVVKNGTNYALIKVFLKNGDYTAEAEEVIYEIKTVMSDNLASDEHYNITGSAVTAVNSRLSIQSEVPIILLIAVAIVILVLLFTTRSWIEPFILLIVIGTAILINMGTNYFLGQISFISNSISSILLIALAMDYSIVLINRFREEKEKTPDPHEAMKNALKGSIVTIIASGCTVMAGLISLVFMDYKIGMDIGLVLTKGVFISILCVIFLMPAILLLFSKALKKTEHKNFFKNISGIGTFAKKTKWVFPIVFLCLACGAFAVQHTMLNFDYVAKFNTEKSQITQDEKATSEIFGAQNSLVVIFRTEKDGNIILTPEEQLQIFRGIEAIEVEGKEKILTASSTFYRNGKKMMFDGKEIEIILGNEVNISYLENIFGVPEYFGSIIMKHLNESGYVDNEKAYIKDVIKFGADEQKSDALITEIVENAQFLKGMGMISDEDYEKLTSNDPNNPGLPFYIKYAGTFLDQEELAESMFNSQNKGYTRMVFNIDATEDSEYAKTFIEKLQTYLASACTNEGYSYNVVCNSQNVIETIEVFKADRLKVDLISAIAILIICLFSFRSVSLPVILVAIIEGSIWVNLAGNALLGNSIFFICYLLGTAIQMGATIDYGILLCDRYKEARKSQDKYTAIKTAIDKSFATIISSGSILTLAAFSIGLISSTPLISSIGFLIGFGALCASLSILFVLPQTLLLLDKFIAKTTLKSNFLFDSKKEKEALIVETSCSPAEKAKTENVNDTKETKNSSENETQEKITEENTHENNISLNETHENDDDSVKETNEYNDEFATVKNDNSEKQDQNNDKEK